MIIPSIRSLQELAMNCYELNHKEKIAAKKHQNSQEKSQEIIASEIYRGIWDADEDDKNEIKAA